MSDTPIQDAEIVEEKTEATDASMLPSDNATVLTSLDELIKSHVTSLDRLRDEIKKHKQMLEDVFVNSEAYRENDAKVKEATKVRNVTKSELMKQPQVMALFQKVKSMVQEAKEKQMSLSDYLLEYQRLSGANQIETDNGEVLEIVQVAKIVRKFSKKDQ
ncbi:MAG: hypothetical protein ACREGI_02025 [Candidatus Levyibacteriota bacterium]